MITIVAATFNGCYLLIPKSYLNKYSDVIGDSINKNLVNTELVYHQIDTSTNKSYSEIIGEPVYNETVYYYFENHLTASIMLPQKINDEWITNLEALSKKLKSREIDQTTFFIWDFYETKGDVVIKYTVEFQGESYYVFNRGRTVKRKLVNTPYGLVLKKNYEKYINDTSLLKYKASVPVHCPIKPDPTKSDIYCLMKTKRKNYRRFYPPSSPKYRHPCKD